MLAAAGLLAGLAAAGPDTLVVGILSDPVSLDPHRATDIVSIGILANVCEPLVRYRADGSRPEPVLATTWASADGRRWTITLRPGATFHDGAPLDADAVAANLRSIAGPRGLPLRAERIGPAVVGVTLEQPNAALMATLSQPFFAMVSPRELGRPEPHEPIGTGPFRLVAARAGSWELAANPRYWGRPPHLARVVFRRLADEAAMAAALKAGEIDLTSALDHEHAAEAQKDPAVVVRTQTGLNVAFLALNNDRGPFRDRRVRQALARAIDRPGLVSDVLAGQGEAARNPLPPSLWGYGIHTKELVREPPAARRLLREAGYPRGIDATLLVVDAPRPYNPTPLHAAERVARDLAEVGVRLRLVRVPTWNEYLERTTRGDYEAAIMGWQADSTDPNDFLSALLASGAVGATNRSRYRSPEMDGLLKQGRRGSDQRERAETYARIQALFQRDMPWVPLYHVSIFTAYRRSVHGLVLGPTGVARLDTAWKTR